MKRKRTSSSSRKPGSKPQRARTPNALDPSTLALRDRRLRTQRNRVARSEAYHRLRGAKAEAKRARRLARRKEEKKKGPEKCPKPVPKSQEDFREPDPTMDQQNVIPSTAESTELAKAPVDEFTPHFTGEPAGGSPRKVLLTTCYAPCVRTKRAITELKWLFPGAKYYPRGRYPLREVCGYARKAHFTHVVSLSQSHGRVVGMTLCHLPTGPTMKFRLSSLQLAKEIENAGERTGHVPELFLRNFDTAVGKRVGRMLSSMFPIARDFRGRAIVSMLHKRDFIFVRAHRYIFKDMEEVAIQELGPRFTLRLTHVYKDTYQNSHPSQGKHMELEWERKREKNRREIAL